MNNYKQMQALVKVAQALNISLSVRNENNFEWYSANTQLDKFLTSADLSYPQFTMRHNNESGEYEYDELQDMDRKLFHFECEWSEEDAEHEENEYTETKYVWNSNIGRWQWYQKMDEMEMKTYKFSRSELLTSFTDIEIKLHLLEGQEHWDLLNCGINQIGEVA